MKMLSSKLNLNPLVVCLCFLYIDLIHSIVSSLTHSLHHFLFCVSVIKTPFQEFTLNILFWLYLSSKSMGKKTNINGETLTRLILMSIALVFCRLCLNSSSSTFATGLTGIKHILTSHSQYLSAQFGIIKRFDHQLSHKNTDNKFVTIFRSSFYKTK